MNTYKNIPYEVPSVTFYDISSRRFAASLSTNVQVDNYVQADEAVVANDDSQNW